MAEFKKTMDLWGKLENMRILLIDDDEIIRDSMGLFFRNKGCYLLAVETAYDGLGALKKERFDIILAEYHLQGMDGLEFIKLASRSHPNTINILITTYGCDDITSETLREGVHDFIQKPFSPKTIIESLALLIEKREEKSQQ